MIFFAGLAAFGDAEWKFLPTRIAENASSTRLVTNARLNGSRTIITDQIHDLATGTADMDGRDAVAFAFQRDVRFTRGRAHRRNWSCSHRSGLLKLERPRCR